MKAAVIAGAGSRLSISIRGKSAIVCNGQKASGAIQ